MARRSEQHGVVAGGGVMGIPATYVVARLRLRLALVLVATWAALLGTAVAQSPFTAGTLVVVATDALRVRDDPSLSADVVGVQRTGAFGRVADATPFWSDGYWWWNVDYDQGADGWSAEGDVSERYLAERGTPDARPEALPVDAEGSAPASADVATGDGSLTIVVIPSIMSALSLSRSNLVVVLEGPVARMETVENVAPAYPVTVEFADLPSGTYTVTAHHGASSLAKEVRVGGRTLEVDFVMQ